MEHAGPQPFSRALRLGLAGGVGGYEVVFGEVRVDASEHADKAGVIGPAPFHSGRSIDPVARYESKLLGALVSDDKDHRQALPENPMSADRVRWEHIQRVFELCNRNVSETERRLNMHRRTLQRILAKRAPK